MHTVVTQSVRDCSAKCQHLCTKQQQPAACIKTSQNIERSLQRKQFRQNTSHVL